MKKFDNFCRALDNLGEIYRYEAPYDTVVLTGLVGLYQICFEQSWKAIKEVLTDQGFPESQTGSPKQILKTAHQAGMIADMQSTAARAQLGELLKYATIIISSVPLLVMFPFFQKHFDAGIMVGSVKG